MTDMGWSRYVSSIEEGNYLACKYHSAKFNVDGPNIEYDCEDAPCYSDCPFIIGYREYVKKYPEVRDV